MTDIIKDYIKSSTEFDEYCDLLYKEVETKLLPLRTVVENKQRSVIDYLETDGKDILNKAMVIAQEYIDKKGWGVSVTGDYYCYSASQRHIVFYPIDNEHAEYCCYFSVYIEWSKVL